MMRAAWQTFEFAVKSVTLFVIVAVVITGYSCYRHGDLGPYPEVDYMAWVAIGSMLLTYAIERGQEP